MIDELMIIDKGGTPLFYHSFIHKDYFDDNFYLIASFLDQISRFTKVVLKRYLNMIEWKNFIFFFYIHKETEFLLIFKCDNTKIDDVSMIKKFLDMLAKNIFNRFLKRFKDDLIEFNGNVSRFKEFSKEINDIFKLKK